MEGNFIAHFTRNWGPSITVLAAKVLFVQIIQHMQLQEVKKSLKLSIISG